MRKSVIWMFAGALAVMTGLGAAPVRAEEATFAAGTRVNGADVGGLTPEQAKAVLENADRYQLEIIERDGGRESIRGSEIGCQIRLTGDPAALLAEQNAGGRAVGPGARLRFTAAAEVSYDEAALSAKIASLSCVSGEGVVPTLDAHISAYQEGQPFAIVKETQGNELDAEKTAQVIRDAVSAGAASVDLDAAGCYRTIAVRSTDDALRQLLDDVNGGLAGVTVTYVFGDQTEELEGGAIVTWLRGSEGCRLSVDRDAAAAYVAGLAERYDTAGKARDFRTVTGRDVSVTGSYGWKIDQAAETDALIEVIRQRQSVTREPVYAQAAATRDAMDWGTTYAEVDLTGQHVYMVRDGQVLWDSPCVTGLASDPERVTPPGLFTIAYKEKDRVLRGRKRADGSYEYENPVSYWMPFNGGIGFHDASWRSSFGGTIYRNNGSHGCVNLPVSAAGTFYEMAYQGMPVVCYE